MSKGLVAPSILHALSLGTNQFSGLEFVQRVVVAHLGCLHRL